VRTIVEHSGGREMESGDDSEVRGGARATMDQGGARRSPAETEG